MHDTNFMKTTPKLNDLFQEESVTDRYDFDDEPEPDDRERCHCQFCACMQRTAYGVCNDCMNGAHQG